MLRYSPKEMSPSFLKLEVLWPFPLGTVASSPFMVLLRGPALTSPQPAWQLPAPKSRQYNAFEVLKPNPFQLGRLFISVFQLQACGGSPNTSSRVAHAGSPQLPVSLQGLSSQCAAWCLAERRINVRKEGGNMQVL